MSKEMSHRISAGAIVEREERLLLVHHKKAGHYDFWVSPGGGVKGEESLHEAAVREVREEAGLNISASRLLYIEEFFNPECRYLKFWFAGHYVGGEIDINHPEARAEHIVDAAWFRQDELAGKRVFPTIITERYWSDRTRGFDAPIHLPLKKMTIW